MEFIDLKAQYRALKPEIDANIQAVLDAGQFIGGPYVKELERQLAEYVGRKHCISCGNGTDALQAAYMALGVGEGDAVFCPDCTFIASVEPANMLGATPVFCDVSIDSYNLAPESLERQIQAVLSEGKLKPRVVVAVDFLGNPCDYDAIAAICDKYGLTLLEDAAQSMGASYKGKMCCSFGTISTTSFFPAKTLGCYGDGGAIFTDDDALADLLRSICVHGKGPGGKYDNIRAGVNSRLDNLQAAILLPKLEALEEYEIRDREAAAGRYSAAFQGKFVLPPVEQDSQHSWYQYTLLAADTAQRARLIAHLKERGIPTNLYYPTPMHMLPVFRALETYGETYPNAVEYCNRTISIPMHPYLEESVQEELVKAVLETL